MKKPKYVASVSTDVDVFNQGFECHNYGCVWEINPNPKGKNKIIWRSKWGYKTDAPARRSAEKHIKKLTK